MGRVESKYSGNSSFPSIGGSKARSSLNVSFNCPGGWDVVSQHVDQCMLKAGYKETGAGLRQRASSGSNENEGLDELNPVLHDPDSGDESSSNMDWLNNMRMYEKQGGRYKVTLQNFGAMMAAYANSTPGSPAISGNMGMGDFSLGIIEY